MKYSKIILERGDIMAKTKEELEQLKNEYNALKNKLKELDEEELGSIVGARDEHTILPKDGDMWESWNPFIINPNIRNKNLDLLNNSAKGDVTLENATFNGNISNREDK